MRIFDSDNKQAIKHVILYLEIDEAKEMLGDLQSLIEQSNKTGQHAHINDASFEHEITLTIYKKNNLEAFDVTSQRLIKNEK